MIMWKLIATIASLMTASAMPLHYENSTSDSTTVDLHEFGVFEVVVDTDFEEYMTPSSEWTYKYKDDVIKALDIPATQLDIIAIRQTNEEPAVLNIIYTALGRDKTYNNYITKLTELVESGYDFPKLDTEFKAITYNQNTVYEKTRWQKIKAGANENWDSFSNAEVSAPIVTAVSLSIGLPLAICFTLCALKYRRVKDNMNDEGVVSVKLSTRKHLSN
tara:strand:- start:879 stop:1532 length:654 start_codon:yes stop_codon:yes gene_type:complete